MVAVVATKLNFLRHTYRVGINHKTVYSQTFSGPHFGSWTNSACGVKACVVDLNLDCGYSPMLMGATYGSRTWHEHISVKTFVRPTWNNAGDCLTNLELVSYMI